MPAGARACRPRVCVTNIPVRASEWVGDRHKPAQHKTFVHGNPVIKLPRVGRRRKKKKKGEGETRERRLTEAAAALTDMIQRLTTTTPQAAEKVSFSWNLQGLLQCRG